MRLADWVSGVCCLSSLLDNVVHPQLTARCSMPLHATAHRCDFFQGTLGAHIPQLGHVLVDKILFLKFKNMEGNRRWLADNRQ